MTRAAGTGAGALLREPLVHFLAIGGLLFAAHAWTARGEAADGARETVRVTEGDVVWLRETWARQRQRDPTPEEMRGLVESFVREEVLAREARAMRLDERDTVVRRRLAQKLEFLLADASRAGAPDEADLRRFHAERPDLFRTPPRISFTQVRFRTDTRPAAAADAAAVRDRLARGECDAESAGDPSLLEPACRDADEESVASQFGPEFARSVFSLPAGTWHGPVASAHGLHVVRVDEIRPGGVREFDEVRARVAEAWRAEREREDAERFVAAVRSRYDVVADESVRPLLGAAPGAPR